MPQADHNQMPTVGTLARELFNCYDYFLRFSGFFGLYLAMYCWSIWNSPNMIFQPFCGSKVKKIAFSRYLNDYTF